MVNACYKCTKRTAMCHATCEDYIKFSEKNAQARAERAKRKKEYLEVGTVVREGQARMVRKRKVRKEK